MDGIHLSLSDSQTAFVGEQVVNGSYADANDYLRALIDEKAKAQAQVRLEALLQEGLKGEATQWTEADTADLKRLATTGR